MKSLAESLGLTTSGPETVQSDSSKATAKKQTAKSIAKDILESKDYKASLERRIINDTLPPAVEVMLHHFAYGKPVDKVEIRDKTDALAGLTLEQLQARATELAALAQKLRGQSEDNTVQSSPGSQSVH
jgi:hypothetical protein